MLNFKSVSLLIKGTAGNTASSSAAFNLSLVAFSI